MASFVAPRAFVLGVRAQPGTVIAANTARHLSRGVGAPSLKVLRSRGFATMASDLNNLISPACESSGLSTLGIVHPSVVRQNLPYQELRAFEEQNKEGVVTNHGGTLTVDTGVFTGRSPKDKFIVKRAGAESEKHVWWGSINQPIKPEIFDELFGLAVDHFNSKDACFVFDGFVGASPSSRRTVKFVTDLAWQQHFVTNMFIRPGENGQPKLDPRLPKDLTVINACAVKNKKWKEHGLNSDVAVAVDIEKGLAVILGTWYGGENKKLAFSMCNYWLPLEGTLSMHCSASVDKQGGNAALFFGLSGTGKTTLSADPNRMLIGDDEHGWHSSEGIFNLEGGCYAKTIDLEKAKEPDIWKAIKGPAALLENVAVNDKGDVDFHDTTKTQNGRVSYPIHHIENHVPSGCGGHPRNVVFLTCDAFGVLPPVAKLTNEQALYHFITGYTAKVAGTERGVVEPEATFSACFGAAFMTLHPTKYAELLRQRLEEHDTNVYLVNTGWAGGGYGVGKRMAIDATRSCITAVLDGSIEALPDEAFVADPVFQFKVPTAVPGVAADVPLVPRDAWTDDAAYDKARDELAVMFQENFKKFAGPGVVDYTSYGPQLAK